MKWQDQALCLEVGGDFWHPEKGGSTREGKKICFACPVREACLEHALEHDERLGIWGGLSERQRKTLQRQRREEQERGAA